MKKLFLILNFSFLILHSAFAQMQMIVDSSGNLQYPTADNFKQANDIASLGGYVVAIDTTPSVNAFDSLEHKSFTVQFPTPYYETSKLLESPTANMGADIDGGWAWNSTASTEVQRGDWVKGKAIRRLETITSDLPDGINYGISIGNTSSSYSLTYPSCRTDNYFLRNENIYFEKDIPYTYKISFWARKNASTTSGSGIQVGIFNHVLAQVKWADFAALRTWYFYEFEGSFTPSISAYLKICAGVIGSSGTNLTTIGVSIADFKCEVRKLRTEATNADGSEYSASQTVEFTTPKITEWKDGELKAMSELPAYQSNNGLAYWYSTQRGGLMLTEYEKNPATDLNARCWYTCPDYEMFGVGYGRKWIEYVYDFPNARTIFEHAKNLTGLLNPTISSIIIRPNYEGYTVGGTPIKDIFKDTGYNYIILKCSTDNYEKNADGFAVWRAVQPYLINQKKDNE